MRKMELIWTLLSQSLVTLSIAQKSAIISEMPSLDETFSPVGTAIRCSFEMMKGRFAEAVIPHGSETCEKMFSPNNLTGFHYFRMTAYYSGTERKKVKHYLYNEVKVGDKFQFTIRKRGKTKFMVWFKSNQNSMLIFDAVDGRVFLKDEVNDVIGERVKTSTYPFNEFKDYTVVFEVLEKHWQIYIDDSAFVTFDHRQPFSDISTIDVITMFDITYLSRMSDPKVQ